MYYKKYIDLIKQRYLRDTALAAGRAPLETGNPLACDATHSRLEGSLRRSDIYRAPEH